MVTLNTIGQTIKTLQNGGVAIIPTDTLYGVVCSASSKIAVKKLYKIKQRDNDKPCIILVNSYSQIENFGIKITPAQKEFMEKYWPGAVSIVLSCNSKKFEYLHKGISSIAFRLIGKKSRNLFSIIESVGPLLAPSANPQGMIPATCVYKSYRYFGESVDAYLDGGTRKSLPSTLVDYTKAKPKILRPGKVTI